MWTFPALAQPSVFVAAPGDLAYLRDALMAPVEGDGEAGFRYQDNESERFELPGLWFSERELYSLLMAHQLLAGLDAGAMRLTLVATEPGKMT